MSDKPARKTAFIKGQTTIAPPWQPCEVSRPEHAAIKALFEGKATEDQQHQFIEWFRRATAMGDMEFHPLGDRESCFASGKRFIGRMFFTLVKSSLSKTE